MSTLVMRELVIVAFISIRARPCSLRFARAVANAGGRRVARRSSPWLFSLIVGVQTGFFAVLGRTFAEVAVRQAPPPRIYFMRGRSTPTRITLGGSSQGRRP